MDQSLFQLGVIDDLKRPKPLEYLMRAALLVLLALRVKNHSEERVWQFCQE
jgi:hypothetical protein